MSAPGSGGGSGSGPARGLGRRALLPHGRGLLIADGLVIAWIVFWLVIGVRVYGEVRDVGKISSSVERVGSAISDTGSALSSLSGVPVIGDQLAKPAGPISEAGDAAQLSARKSRSSAQDLSVLLALTIALAPTLPMLLLYLPDRIEVDRDRRAVARAAAGGVTAELAELLARRAAVHLPLHQLRDVSDNPYADIAAGDFDALALAELRRIGVRPGPGAPAG